MIHSCPRRLLSTPGELRLTGVAIAFAPSPTVLAHNAWDLAALSGWEVQALVGNPGAGSCRTSLRHAMACLSRQQAPGADPSHTLALENVGVRESV